MRNHWLHIVWRAEVTVHIDQADSDRATYRRWPITTGVGKPIRIGADGWLCAKVAP